MPSAGIQRKRELDARTLKISELRKKGWGINKLAREFGIAPASIRQALIRQKLKDERAEINPVLELREATIRVLKIAIAITSVPGPERARMRAENVSRAQKAPTPTLLDVRKFIYSNEWEKVMRSIKGCGRMMVDEVTDFAVKNGI